MANQRKVLLLVEPTVEQTAVREVKEETGLTVEITGKLGDCHEQGVQDAVEYDYYSMSHELLYQKHTPKHLIHQPIKISSVRGKRY